MGCGGAPSAGARGWDPGLCFRTKSERDAFRRRAHALGAESTIHDMDVPLEVIWERLAARNQSAGENAVRLSKNPGRAREGRSPLEYQSTLAACTAGSGGFLRRKNLFSRAKIVSLQFLRPESVGFKQKLEGVAGRLKTLWVFRFRPWRNCRRLKSKI